MRPHSLDPLFASAASLSGIGPKISKNLDRLLGRTSGARVIDVLFLKPTGVIDRRTRPKIRDAVWGSIVTIKARVVEHRPPGPRARGPYRVVVEDDTGDMELVFFLTNNDWVKNKLPVGESRWISGKLELFDGHLQIVHPDKVMTDSEIERLTAVEPVYPLVEGLTQGAVRKATQAALGRTPILPEWLAPSTLATLEAGTFVDALTRLHRPLDPTDIDARARPLRRLAFDELFANQLALGLVRERMRTRVGRANVGDGRLVRAIRASLPYRLTTAQERALGEIGENLAAQKRMIRLLQGDVGSGKTIVALLAMAQVVEGGRQAGLMAPTEVLARQHAQRLGPIAQAAGMRLELFVGAEKASERRRLLADLAAGAIDIAVGTHALFQPDVTFRDLGLAVIDEQHRFGVQQRLALLAKGEGVDLLSMTATPIPRTLLLAFFGDMDVSDLREKPAGRLPIATRAIPLDRLEEVIGALERALAKGQRIYWICPLVDESETLEVAAAEERAAFLRGRFGALVGLVHGRMKGDDKDEALASFQRGDTRILVATTVVEVGVDVPEATIIVIEHAERFGLAQLHQLRGRVGRGAEASSCVLLYKAPLGESAKARLSILRETEDGFRIAEQDLRLRGEGDVLGLRQSGMPSFHFADVEVHQDLLRLARDKAQAVIAASPGLTGEENRALRTLLYLFERDEAIRLLEGA